MIETIVQVDGMMCGMCESHINDAIRSHFQVKKVSSSHTKGQTVIQSQEPLDREQLAELQQATEGWMAAVYLHLQALADRGTAPVPDSCRLIDLLRRPQVGYDDLTPFDPAPPDLPPAVREQVEITVKYEGYIRRQEKQVEEFEKLERRRLPPDMDYSHIQGLRLEAREKLAALRPENLGQAGVSPADIAALMVYLHTRETPPEGGTST